MRLLIVEDEELLATTLARGLRRRGYAVDVALDGDDGLSRALVHEYDVIVLDRDLPRIHGDEVCQHVREAGRPARIIMLTAAAGLDDLVAGLGTGADDYLTKPFRFDELVARIGALGRRGGVTARQLLRHGDLELDIGGHGVRRSGVEVVLTARELAVLEILVRAAGAVVSAEELLEKAWDEMADPFTTSVRVIVSRLRAKLGEPAIIDTVVGRGYRLIEPVAGS